MTYFWNMLRFWIKKNAIGQSFDSITIAIDKQIKEIEELNHSMMEVKINLQNKIFELNDEVALIQERQNALNKFQKVLKDGGLNGQDTKRLWNMERNC